MDPGGDLEKVQAAVERLGPRVGKIFLTQAHIGHGGSVAALARQLSVPIEGPHKDDKFRIDMLPEQGAMFGLPGGEVFEPNRWLEGGDTVRFGNCELEVGLVRGTHRDTLCTQ